MTLAVIRSLALAVTLAALWLLVVAVLSLEAQAAPKHKRNSMSTEHRIYNYATVTPFMLCPKLQRGKWLRLAIAQQADGGKWEIACAY